MAFFAQNVSSMFVEEEIKKNLFRNAMSGKWDEVIKTYAQSPEAHSAKITRSEDTALHIAISDSQETTVELLMEEIIRTQNSWEVLKIGNELGNMPLHLAASLGNVKMCKLIAGVDSRLIGERNKDNETPFFLAVLHGNRDAFLCLHSMCKGEGYAYCKKKDNGETILHSAIGGEYFAGRTKNENKGPSDAENPKGQQSDPKQGSRDIVKLREKKEKHIWSVQIMDELLKHASTYEYENNGTQGFMLQKPDGSTPFPALGNGIPFLRLDPLSNPMSGDDLPPQTSREGDRRKVWGGNAGNRDNGREMEKGETPILTAAKNGVVEMVQKILELFPVAIHDMNTDEKNIVLLAVENRHSHVYKFLLDKKIMKETTFRKVDMEGNSALHLAAKLRDHRPWLIPGAALQLQWEIKWYEFVKNSMPLHFFVRYNRDGKTPRDIFSESHQKLVKSGGKWLTSTSESCSVVAALIATIAFATSTTFPGGFREDSDKPIFENEPAFNIFAISSLVALCFSVTAVVMFLAILTSRRNLEGETSHLYQRLLDQVCYKSRDVYKWQRLEGESQQANPRTDLHNISVKIYPTRESNLRERANRPTPGQTSTIFQ
ncbi:ankyrin repeat-containing protein ITN1 [Forsythia ovata]|uniref:Ankyrin repeat-containing protein ITN1 n=1 Tax=Forsythia ovata TaxID=205694 RepID=A0ABD1VEN5_9LAMI